MAAVAVPPADRSYRWAHITDDDQSGVLYIVTFLSFTYTSLTFLTRIFIKWRMLGLDDAAMLLAQVSLLVFASKPYVKLTQMLGGGLDPVLTATPVVVGRTGKVLWDLDR